MSVRFNASVSGRRYPYHGWSSQVWVWDCLAAMISLEYGGFRYLRHDHTSWKPCYETSTTVATMGVGSCYRQRDNTTQMLQRRTRAKRISKFFVLNETRLTQMFSRGWGALPLIAMFSFETRLSVSSPRQETLGTLTTDWNELRQIVATMTTLQNFASIPQLFPELIDVLQGSHQRIARIQII